MIKRAAWVSFRSDFLQSFCNEHSVRLWNEVRAAQVQRMCDFQAMPVEPVTRLVSFYSHMMYTLGVLGARLQVMVLGVSFYWAYFSVSSNR